MWGAQCCRVGVVNPSIDHGETGAAGISIGLVLVIEVGANLIIGACTVEHGVMDLIIATKRGMVTVVKELAAKVRIILRSKDEVEERQEMEP